MVRCRPFVSAKYPQRCDEQMIPRNEAAVNAPFWEGVICKSHSDTGILQVRKSHNHIKKFKKIFWMFTHSRCRNFRVTLPSISIQIRTSKYSCRDRILNGKTFAFVELLQFCILMSFWLFYLLVLDSASSTKIPFSFLSIGLRSDIRGTKTVPSWKQ